MLVDLWEFWWKKMSAVDSIIILNLTPRLTSTIGHKSEQTRFLDFLNFFMSCRRRFWHYLINRSDSKRHLWSFWAAWKDQLAAQIWHFLNIYLKRWQYHWQQDFETQYVIFRIRFYKQMNDGWSKEFFGQVTCVNHHRFMFLLKFTEFARLRLFLQTQ